MAFNSMLRKASSALLPLAIRSSRTFQRSIPAVLCIDKHGLVANQSFLPLSRFSTDAALKQSSDVRLIQVLDSEIECAEEPHDVESVPDGFPFEIEDIPGERTVLLKRKYLDETIKVEVDMPNVEVEEGNEDDDNTESNAPPSVPLVVTISKDNSSQFLEIGVTAFPDEISIDSLAIKDSSISEDQLAYEGPDFNDLDENLQKAFHKYLEIRGIKPSTTNFLLEYMTEKDNREYLKWLNNIKDFVGKKA
ncbi:hypothetical protein K2173_008918 [Erythroxylum novogranatense]|uniref:Mitochondrial glycoprotein n=1 Tax=Erythroxylum novogranatense TaxID=1862640 RepID=A0AAV8S4W1_9ROSI|nr:hypothetical protein K2173_008918 [Erythroxylum novogranatense]